MTENRRNPQRVFMVSRTTTWMLAAAIAATTGSAIAQLLPPADEWRCWDEIPHKSLHVCLEPQLRPAWCWAASAQMIMTKLLPDHSEEFQQPILATRGYGINCPTVNCSPGPASDCDKRGLFPDFMALDSRFRARSVSRALTWDELTEEIVAGRPVGFSWCWRTPGDTRACDADPQKDSGHFMVAAGIDSIDVNVAGMKQSVRAVRVLQPLCCCQGDKGYLTYEEYRQGNGHLHWRDYYCISVAGTPCSSLSAQGDGSGFEPDTPAFAGPRPAAEAVRSAWLTDLESVWRRDLGISPMALALGNLTNQGITPAMSSTPTMLEEEIPVRIILPHDLANSSEDVTLEALMHDVGVRLFPLHAISPASAPWISTIEVRQGADTQWRVAAVGRPYHAAQLLDAWERARIDQEDMSLMEVRFLGLNTSLLIRIDPKNRLNAYPTCGECLGLPRTKKMIPLADALKLLRIAAKAYQGGPT
jgi:hypothetical protein